jgi:hypothetical protein
MSAALLIGGRESSTERSRQSRCFAIEQQLRRPSRPVLRPARPAGGISELPLGKRSTSNPFSCRCCFLHRNISHRSTSIGRVGARRRMPSGDRYYVIMAILLLLYEPPKDDPAQQREVATVSRTARMGPRERGAARSFRWRCRAAEKSPSLAEGLALLGKIWHNRRLSESRFITAR